MALKENSQERLLRLLSLFADEEKGEWSVDEASIHLGISASQTYRYFRTLASAGYISAYTTGRYVLGPAIIELDRKLRIGDPMIHAARSIMREMLSTAPSASIAILCRYFRGQVMCVHEEFETYQHHEISYERGQPRPLYQGAASKVILANLPLRQARAYFNHASDKFNQFGLGANWTEVKRSLRELRSQPAIITAGELGTSASGISAPIYDDKRVLGSVSLVLPITVATEEVTSFLMPVVAAAGQEMTRKMQHLAQLQQ